MTARGGPWQDPAPRADLAVSLLGLLLLLGWDAAGLDLPLVRPWGTAAGFPWSENFWTRAVLHDGGRDLGWLLFAAVVLAGWRGAMDLPAARWRAAALTMLACVLSVSWLKGHSLTSCPWSLAEFGGRARHVSHWAWGVGDGGPGHCFPSGHASTGFAYFAVYFALRPRHPGRAGLVLGLTLASGLLFGADQMLRGAHYASHTLWTAWICWTLGAAACHFVWPRAARAE